MLRAVRTAWNANRHWLAAGFLLSTSLFLLLLFLDWRNERRGIASQSASGLAPGAWQPTLHSFLPLPPLKPLARARVDFANAMVGGVPGGIVRQARLSSSADKSDQQMSDRLVIKSGTLEIIATNPAQAAEQLRSLAALLSGFVVSSNVSGGDDETRSAQVTMRVPAEHFDEARAQVRRIASAVEQDTVEARDVTRQYVDQEATLRNSRAEEVQYLAILKRATAVSDVLEASSKLAEVRGHIEELEADLRLLRHQVEMSQLTINLTAKVEAQVFGIHWRPLYQAKLSLRGALSGLAGYGDSMVELLLNVPVIVTWGFTIVALIKIGWIVLRRIVLLFFPELATWLRRPRLQATPS